MNQTAKLAFVLSISGTGSPVPDPETRALLAGHARFFLRASRLLKAPHLAEVEMQWIRTIEFDRAGLEIQLTYSRLNGCVLTVDHAADSEDKVPISDDPIIGTKDRKMEPIRARISWWQERLRANAHEFEDFRKRTILRALFHGFREPLRKGRTKK